MIDPPVLLTPQVYYTSLAAMASTTAYLTPQDVDGGQPDYSMPLSYNWSLGVQRNVGRGLVLDVAYVGNTSRHQYITVPYQRIPYGATRLANGQLNPATIDPTTAQPQKANFLRPYLGYGAVSFGQYSNNELSFLADNPEQAIWQSFSGWLSWTWSKVMSYAPAAYVSNRFTYAPDNNDRRHNVAMNWSYRVPDGTVLWNNPVAKQVLNGWVLSGFASFLTGAPTNISYSVTGVPAGYTVTGSPSPLTTRIQIAGDVSRPESERTDKRISSLNPAAFALPASSAFGIGNSARTFFWPGASKRRSHGAQACFHSERNLAISRFRQKCTICRTT